MSPIKNENHGTGVVDSTYDIRDYRANLKAGLSYFFADSFELPMPHVKSQGKIKSCVAHALATEIEYFDKKETGEYHRMSTDYIYGNRRMTTWLDEGMRIRDAIKTAKEYGDVTYSYMPGNTEVPAAIEKFERKAKELKPYGKANRIGKYFRLNSSKAIKACLIDYGPVIVSVDWCADYRMSDNLLILDGSNYKGSHCLMIYGWCPRGWLVQNSWGDRWGSGGRAVLPYDSKLNEAWGIEDADNDADSEWLDIIAPFSTELGCKFAKAVNAILNKVFKRR